MPPSGRIKYAGKLKVKKIRNRVLLRVKGLCIKPTQTPQWMTKNIQQFFQKHDLWPSKITSWNVNTKEINFSNIPMGEGEGGIILSFPFLSSKVWYNNKLT